MKLLLALLCLSLSAHAQLLPGETELTLPGGARYQGTVKDGKPDGHGYLRAKNGVQYEGGFKEGKQHGNGILVTALGDRYEGQFENGQFNGQGKMVFRLGGSYEGQWKQGRFQGKGVMVYAGSGRTFDGQFVDGRIEGAKAPARAAAVYSLRDDTTRLGTHLRETAIDGVPYPLDKRFEEMGEAEQDAVRAPYRALAPGDEPPFPVNGMKDIVIKIKHAQTRVHEEGTLTLVVDVQADGKPATVTMIGLENQDLSKFVGTVFMQEKYKPAKCDGKPCAMPFIYSIRFSVKV